MNLDGTECVSVGVHVVGVLVGYCGYANSCTVKSRIGQLIDELDLSPHMLPAMIRAAAPGSDVVQPKSKTKADEPGSDVDQ